MVAAVAFFDRIHPLLFVISLTSHADVSIGYVCYNFSWIAYNVTNLFLTISSRPKPG